MQKYTNRVNHIVINRDFQRYLLFCWWKNWHFLLLASSFNFGSKVMTAKRRQWWCTCAVRSLWSSCLKRQTRNSTLGRPTHSEDSHCYFAKSGKIWTSPPLSKIYFSGVQSQNISFAATSSRSWISISSIVPHKRISIRAHDGFSQHEYFSLKNSKSITNFFNFKSSQNTKKVRIDFKQLIVFLLKQCFRMLHALENEISLRERSGSTAQLHIFDGTMIISIWILAVFTHFRVSFTSHENSVIFVTKK